MEKDSFILQMKSITKEFPAVKALDNVNHEGRVLIHGEVIDE